jgi:hypothetical protein
MATAQRTEMQHRQPARWGRNLTILALVAAIAVTAWFWTRMRETSLANAASAAQTGCLCRFAAGRDIASCAIDPGVSREWVSLGEDAAAGTVTATVPMLARQTARWTPSQGCVLEPWRD